LKIRLEKGAANRQFSRGVKKKGEREKYGRGGVGGGGKSHRPEFVNTAVRKRGPPRNGGRGSKRGGKNSSRGKKKPKGGRTGHFFKFLRRGRGKPTVHR